MSKRRKKLDACPNQLKLDFEIRLESYQQAKEEILEACDNSEPTKSLESEAEACIEIAARCKRAIRHSGLSREQVVDGINDYFGRGSKAPKDQSTRKPLSIHMLNNYLSKPIQYPIPSYVLFAIQYVTKSLELAIMYAEPMAARVISGAEIRHMALGKLDETLIEMQRLKKELRNGRA